MMTLKLLEIIIACEPMPGSTIVEDNDTISLIGFGVVIGIFIAHLFINQWLFKKAGTKSLFFYVIPFLLFLLGAGASGGDCGSTLAGASIINMILAGFWVIFAPLVTNAIAKHRQNLNSTPPFANPDEEKN